MVGNPQLQSGMMLSSEDAADSSQMLYCSSRYRRFSLRHRPGMSTRRLVSRLLHAYLNTYLVQHSAEQVPGTDYGKANIDNTPSTK